MSDRTYLRVKSHRAAKRLERLLAAELDWYFSFGDSDYFVLCPNKHLQAATAIPGVTRARPKHELMKCWSFI